MRAPAALSAAQGRPVLWQSLALMDRRFGQGGIRRSATGECPRSVPSSLSSGAPCRQYAQNAHRYVVPIFRKLSWLLRLAVPAMLHSRERGQARSQARTPPRFHNAAIVRMCAQTRSLFASFPFFFPVSFAFVSYLPVLPWQCFSGREAGSCPVSLCHRRLQTRQAGAKPQAEVEEKIRNRNRHALFQAHIFVVASGVRE